MLHHNGHFRRVALAQPVGDLNVRVRGVEGDKEMMLAREPVRVYVCEHGLDQTAHRVVHEISVINRI